MEKKTGCDWSGTEKRGGVHLPGNTQKGEVVKKLAGDLLSNDSLTQICLGEVTMFDQNENASSRRRRRTVFKKSSTPPLPVADLFGQKGLKKSPCTIILVMYSSWQASWVFFHDNSVALRLSIPMAAPAQVQTLNWSLKRV